jgi:hypothetical protein
MMKTAGECFTPRNTTKGFGSYDPLSDPGQQQYFAMDVLRVVQGLLAGGMQGGDLSDEAILSAGALLDAATEVLAWQGLPSAKEGKAQLAQLRANILTAAKQRREGRRQMRGKRANEPREDSWERAKRR